MTVLGFDAENIARAVEIEVRCKLECEEYFNELGWTNIIFLED